MSTYLRDLYKSRDEGQHIADHFQELIDREQPRLAEKARLAKLEAKAEPKLKPEDIVTGSFGETETGEDWIAYHWSGLDTSSVVLENGEGFDHPIDFLTSYSSATISGNIFKLMKQGNVLSVSDKCRDYSLEFLTITLQPIGISNSGRERLGELRDKLKACKEGGK